MAIAANNGHAGLGRAKLWPHNMDNAAITAIPTMGLDAVFFGIGEQCFNLTLSLLSHIRP